MADVVGGGTTNVTLYDEDGNPVGTVGHALYTQLLDNTGTPVTGLNPLPVASKFADENGIPYSGTNPLPVDIGSRVTIDSLTVQYDSHISTLNTTQTPLAANEQFVGAWEECVNYAAISLSMRTDVPSAPWGAVIQFSHAGTVVLYQSVATIPGGVPVHYVVSPKARYFRILYTNGPVAQTLMRAEITLRHNAPGTTQVALDAPLHGDAIADVTQSAMLARREGPGPYGPGVFEPVILEDGGAIRTFERTGLVPKTYDDIDIAYNAQGDVDTVTYRDQGAVVATLTLAYSNGNLTGVTRT